MHPYFILGLAICAEVAATSALKASAQFTNLWPSIIVVVGYVVSFYFLMIVVESIAIGITYALWSALGIVLVTLIAIPLYQQIPDTGAIVGTLMIVAGVVVIYLYSDTVNI